MNYISVTSNIFDINIIVNVSIAVVVGLAGANILSTLFLEVCKPLTISLFRTIAFKISPITFFVSVKTRLNRSGLESDWSNIIKIPSIQNDSHLRCSISIQPATKYRFLYKNYKPRMVINFVDPEERLSIQAREKLERQTITRLDEYELGINIGKRIIFSMAKKGNDKLSDYPVTIDVIMDGIHSAHKIMCNPTRQP